MTSIERVGPPKAVGEIPPDSYLWEGNLSGIVATGWIERNRAAGGGTSVAEQRAQAEEAKGQVLHARLRAVSDEVTGL